MKVVLTTMPRDGEAVSWVTPKHFKPDDERMMPLGLLSLATNLPEEAEVVILDPPSRNWSNDRTVEEIEKIQPDVLGLSVVTMRAYPMVEILRRTTAPYKVVGGPHASHYAEVILGQGADAVFIGQLADLEFADAVRSRPKGKIVCKSRIDQIKFPDRSLVDLPFYFPKANLFKAPNRVVMFSSVGCPYRCVFCDVQTKKVQHKTPQVIVDEMVHLNQVGAGSIHILDDCFNISDNAVREICREMTRRGFRAEWSARGKPVMPLETANMLVERGFKRIHVGMESLSDTTLEFYDKPYRYSDQSTFCRTMKTAGIEVLAYFILGAPTDTPEYRRTLGDRIREMGINYPYFNILMAMPNTTYYDDLMKNGVYTKDYWREYVERPVPNFALPFPYGADRYQEDAELVTNLINQFKR